MCSGKYDAPPPPPDGGMWDQLHVQTKTRQQLKLNAKSEKLKPSVGKSDPTDHRTVQL